MTSRFYQTPGSARPAQSHQIKPEGTPITRVKLLQSSGEERGPSFRNLKQFTPPNLMREQSGDPSRRPQEKAPKQPPAPAAKPAASRAEVTSIGPFKGSTRGQGQPPSPQA